MSISHGTLIFRKSEQLNVLDQLTEILIDILPEAVEEAED